MLEYLITFIGILFISFIVFIFSYAFMNTKIILNIDNDTEKKVLKIMYGCVLTISIVTSYIYYLQIKQHNLFYNNTKEEILNIIESHNKEYEHSNKLYDDISDIFNKEDK